MQDRFFSLALSLLLVISISCSRKITPVSTNAVEAKTDTVQTVVNVDDLVVVDVGDTVLIKELDTIVMDAMVARVDSVQVKELDTIRVGRIDTSSMEVLDAIVVEDADTLVIIGTGDIMPGTNYPDNRYLPPGGAARLFDPVEDILHSGDVTFGNLEGVFCSEGGTAKKCSNPKTCYVFRMPDEYLEVILDAGYDVLSVANNHVNDYGYQGRLSTAKLLEDSGVPFAGFVSKPSTSFEKDGLHYGFAAFAPHSGTANLKDYDAAAAIVAQLDSTCDIVIVSFHGGAEGRDHQHIPCTDEIYLGYNRGNACKFAHMVIDAGADVVFGHGPHVARAMDLYKDRLICYSLGNFCTYARFNLSGPNGIAPIVKAYLSEQGEFLYGEVIPVYQPGEGGPQIDPQGRVITKLHELMEADFPHGRIMLEDNGIIRRKDEGK